MKLSTGLVLPVLAGAAYSLLDAEVYLFQGSEWPNDSNPPTLSPTEARLAIAQRLGISQYHSLDGAGDDTLSYVNRFGGPQKQLFEAKDQNKAAELVLFIEGVSSEAAKPILDAWSSIKPAFTISNPPSSSENLELVFNLDRQLGPDVPECPFNEDIDPNHLKCWKGKSKIVHVDLEAKKPGVNGVILAQKALAGFSKSQKMNAMVVLVPESSWSAKSANAYGSYEKLSQKQLHRRQQTEELLGEMPAASPSISQLEEITTSNSSKFIRGVAPLCYSSLDSCTRLTNNCSGHGECYKKPDGTDASTSCFACRCKPQFERIKAGEKTIIRTTYWGGGACQKKDVSGPFWLFATFTIVMVGLVSWAIGALFSIGEEKLPGVIGAGVSSKAT